MSDDDLRHPPHAVPGWSPPRRSPWPFRFLVLMLLAGGIASLFTPFGQRAGRAVSRRLFPPLQEPAPKVEYRDKIVEKVVEVEVPAVPPAPPALPEGPSLSPRGGDLTAMFSGIGLRTSVLPTSGGTATEERASEEAYVVEMVVKVKVPTPATTLEQLLPLNPRLGRILPDLEKLLGKGKVSGFFHYLYELKEKSINANLRRLDRLPSRHNFYDLDSLLELEHPDSQQKVLLMQADMDVVSDGSDGDRMPSFDDYIFKSQHFQPSTSYGWPKVTSKVNPVVPKLEEELREVKEKLAAAGISKDEKASLTSRAAAIPRVIADLKNRSYLIGQEDPFIVIPLSLRSYKGRNAWAPSIGDYAVVIHEDRVLPAVVGDYGPTTKVGEASLRIAREINDKSSPYRRPVSDLKATYLIFPDSADAKRRAPDYAAWRLRCEELLGRIGGLGKGVEVHRWEDRLAAKAAAAAAAKAEAEAKAETAAGAETADKPGSSPGSGAPAAPPEEPAAGKPESGN